MGLLELADVSKVYNEDDPSKPTVTALDDVNLNIERGEFISIVGPSGCGKSTLLEVIAGLQEPTSGELRINGEKYHGIHEDIGVVFQEESTFPWLTVKENVEFGLKMEGINSETRGEAAEHMINLVGLKGYENSYPKQLSGGMRQRVAIARSLVMDPEILLMDEPFGSLDMQTRTILGDELLNIWGEINNTILFVTHDLDEAITLSDRVILMTHAGGIKTIANIEIDRPRDSSIQVSDEFNQISNTLWNDLKEETQESLKGAAG